MFKDLIEKYNDKIYKQVRYKDFQSRYEDLPLYQRYYMEEILKRKGILEHQMSAEEFYNRIIRTRGE